MVTFPDTSSKYWRIVDKNCLLVVLILGQIPGGCHLVFVKMSAAPFAGPSFQA
jgi:hypothetical protein